MKLNIPKTLKEFGIKEDEFKEKIGKIAELAVGDACTGSNPREIDATAMEKSIFPEDGYRYGQRDDRIKADAKGICFFIQSR